MIFITTLLQLYYSTTDHQHVCAEPSLTGL